MRANDLGRQGPTSPWVSLRFLRALQTLTVNVSNNNVMRSAHVNGILFLGGALPLLREFYLLTSGVFCEEGTSPQETVILGNRTVDHIDLGPLAYAHRLQSLTLDFTGIPLRQHRLAAVASLTQLSALKRIVILMGDPLGWLVRMFSDPGHRVWPSRSVCKQHRLPVSVRLLGGPPSAPQSERSDRIGAATSRASWTMPRTAKPPPGCVPQPPLDGVVGCLCHAVHLSPASATSRDSSPQRW